MNIGDSFMHPQWGKAVILNIEQRSRGLFAYVQFGYAKSWMPIGEISGDASIHAPRPAPTPKPTKPTSTPHQNTLPQARAGIQALKLGQVRESQVASITVGAETHIATFTDAIERARKRSPKLIIVEGAWGVGKTHLLTLLSALAVQRDFAVSSTILDGWAATLSDPMRLLASITSSIRFPGQTAAMGVGTMLARVKSHGMPELRGLAGHRMIRLMEEIPQLALDDPEVVSVLEDYLDLSLAAGVARERLRQLGWPNVILPPLKARSVNEKGNRFRELLCDWAAFCVAAGAKGLLVVIDEVDVDYARAPWWGYKRRSVHDGTLRSLGEIHQANVPMIVAFGSAPAGPGADDRSDAVRDVIAKLGHIDAHETASTLTAPQLSELAGRVFDLYGEAYPELRTKCTRVQLDSISKMLIHQQSRQLSPVPRRFVRSLLHCLDMLDLGQATAREITAVAR